MEISNLNFIIALYDTLRTERPDYRRENYKWKIGLYVLNDILSIYGQGLNFNDLNRDKPKTLFGIEVEVDTINPYNLQLYEDITNKIGIIYESEGEE